MSALPTSSALPPGASTARPEARFETLTPARLDAEKIAAATAMMELVDVVMPPEDVNRRIFDQHLDNRGNSKKVGNSMTLNKLPEHFRIELFAGQQHAGRSTRHIEQGMNACAM